MRGEDLYLIGVMIPRAGSPPHARGRQHLPKMALWMYGITPACAGKTLALNI